MTQVKFGIKTHGTNTSTTATTTGSDVTASDATNATTKKTVLTHLRSFSKKHCPPFPIAAAVSYDRRNGFVS